jgi:hypothetical protein
MTPAQDNNRWISAWPDLVAFLLVLGIAWWTRAHATDLVWSLWLSSLVVGYCLILWTILRPAVFGAIFALHERRFVEQAIEHDPRSALLIAGIALVVGVFMVAFFTVHFLGFHYVHSEFLNTFFPLGGADWAGTRPAPLHGRPLFLEVLRRYWVFLPSAFLAERNAFRQPPAAKMDVSVTAQAIAARKAANAVKPVSGMMLPYRKVIRMHVLIFFFAFAHVLRLDNFVVYAVVYAVYFFPWRLLQRAAPEASRPAPERVAA